MNHSTRLFLRRLASGSFVASVVAVGFVSNAPAQTLGPLVQVTGPDPFASCTSDRVSQQETTFGSTLFPNTSIEPWVAVDPTNSSRLLVGHQQDRWSDGGSRGLVGVVSSDGGATWTNTIPNGATSVTIVHNIGTTLYSVAITPLQAASGTVTDLWGPATYSLGGGYWVSGKTAAQFVLNIPSPAPAGGLAFDWMVKAA